MTEKNQKKSKSSVSRTRFSAIVLTLGCWFLVLTAQAQDHPVSNADSLEVKTLFFNALRAKTIENLPEATELFGRVLQKDPANDAAMYELANLHKLQNDYEDARGLLEKAVSISPNNSWYWTALADCYERSNDVDKLENVFKQLVRLDPDKPDNYFDLANVYYHQQRFDEALKIYDELEKIAGVTDDLLADRQKIYLKQNRPDLAVGQLQKMIDANPAKIKYYLFLSELYSAGKDEDKALKVLKDAETINPKSGLVHLALADVYRDKKDYESSYNELSLAFAIPEVDIDQKIKIVMGYLPKFPDPDAKASALELSRIITVAHPDDAKAWALYGDMLLQNGKPGDAKTMYQKSIALNNQSYEVQEQLVRIEVSENDDDDAIKDGENALSFYPNQASMNYLVGVAWMQKKNFDKALSYLKNAVSLELDDKDLLSQAYAALGDCYHSQKDNVNSDLAFDKALSYNANNAFTLNNYAYYLAVRGEQLEKAASMSKRSNDLQPNNASFEDTYAWILFKQKDYAGAKQWIEKALVDDKTNSGVKSEHYGDIMFYLGDVDAAVQNWKKAKANGDQSPLLDKKINERKYVE